MLPLINKPSTVQKAMKTAKKHNKYNNKSVYNLRVVFTFITACKIKKNVNAINETNHLSIKQYEKHNKKVKKELIC